ncbi:MAG: two pore domain potassium channel family protein [Phycisphaerae bacterium]|nr:two pore domain potassium channel family protein [Phycisphaerae bacterium]
MMEPKRTWLHRRWFPGSRPASLLVSLFLLLAIYPQFEEMGGTDSTDHQLARLALYICFTLILLAGAWLVHDRPGTLLVACLLAAPCLILGWLDHSLKISDPATSTSYFKGIISLFFAATTLYVALSQVGFILRAKKINADLLCRAVSVYLLLGVAWMALYGATEQFMPGSFQADKSLLHGMKDNIGFSDHLYYSFSTLSTLGIGDIVPVSSVARSLTLLECVIGPLYLAILLARLVAMYGKEK